MEVEVYRNTVYRQPEVIDGGEVLANIERARVELAQALGMTGQVQRSYAQEVRRKAPYPRLTPTERRAWWLFLPTQVTQSNFANYVYDDVPLGALRAYQEARHSGLFEGFIIRTPEDPRANDPALFGWVKAMINAASGLDQWDHYLIARWGESLLSFPEIRTIARSRQNLFQRWLEPV